MKNKKVILALVIAVAAFAYMYSPRAQKPVEERAWKILENYLEAAKNHDLDNIKKLSYQISEACENPETVDDCNTRMDTVYSFGSEFKKEDFTNVWSDERQIILSTNFSSFDIEEVEVRARGRSIIYFVIKDGDIKLLTFKPAQGTSIPTKDLSGEEVEAKLIELTEDKDEDGLEDVLEGETDPTLRDSDGDGLWDGVEALMYK